MRKRYLALKVVSGRIIEGKEIMNAIWKAILQLFGEYGASQTNLQLIEYDSQKNHAIIQCSHKALEMVKDHEVNLIHNKCILMFAEPVKGPHAFHRFLNRLFGSYPK